MFTFLDILIHLMAFLESAASWVAGWPSTLELKGPEVIIKGKRDILLSGATVDTHGAEEWMAEYKHCNLIHKCNVSLHTRKERMEHQLANGLLCHVMPDYA